MSLEPHDLCVELPKQRRAAGLKGLLAVLCQLHMGKEASGQGKLVSLDQLPGWN